MPTLSAYVQQSKPIIPSSNQSSPISKLAFLGLDLTSPYDAIKDGRTPSAKNFRLYAQKADDRRVAVSNRLGAAFYTNPYGEAADAQNVHNTVSASVKIGVTTPWQSVQLRPTTTGQLTKVEFELGNLTSSSGHIIVELRKNTNNAPGDIIASTGILGSALSDTLKYVTARFIEAPRVLNGTYYWLALHLQDDAVGQYDWGATDTSLPSAYSNSTANAWNLADVAYNFTSYITPDATNKGVYRFAPAVGANKTLAVINKDLYIVDDNQGSYTSLESGLTSRDTDYMFTSADKKVFWVNGFDSVRAWDGTLPGAGENLILNGSFDTDTSGWVPDDNEEISRDTSVYHTSPASLKLLGSGYNEVDHDINLSKNRRYSFSAWVNCSSGDGLIILQPFSVAGTGNDGVIDTFDLTGGVGEFQKVEVSFTLNQDAKRIKIAGNSGFNIDDIVIRDDGIETILDPQLPTLSLALFHGNRLYGVAANDPNKLVFSEEPGNPAYGPDGTTPTPADQQWYHAWLSTSFIYVPRPGNSDPITALASFQDNLIIFTRSSKYVLYGADPGSFSLRQSTGNKGAVHQNAVWTDENFVYFVSDDGLYRFNGSSDELLSDTVQTEYSGIATLDKTCLTRWRRQIRLYYASAGQSVNNRCLIFDTALKEWMMDTDSYVDYAVPYTDGDDPDYLVEMASTQPTLFYADQDPSILGKQIDFEYFCNYDSFGSPAQRKRLKRFFPLVEGQGGNYYIQVGVDKDRENATRWYPYLITTSAPLIGQFKIGDGTQVGSDTSFVPKKVGIPGYGYLWQVRLKNKAIDNKVRFIGYELSLKAKRL